MLRVAVILFLEAKNGLNVIHQFYFFILETLII